MAADAYIKLRNLTSKENEPVKDIIQRGIQELRGLAEKAIIQLHVTGTPAAKAETYSVAITPSGAFLRPDNTIKPTLAVMLSYDSFYRIANGSHSPLQAYLDSELRIVGNADIGKKIIIQLKGSGTQAAVCPFLFNESWQLDGPGFGHITFSGEFFTPFGAVNIVYDWGGGFYHQILTASASGTFTTTEHNLYCGDIPGHPGVGVIVTATDIASGKFTTASYGTPCS
jgi:hypothetical protein